MARALQLIADALIPIIHLVWSVIYQQWLWGAFVGGSIAYLIQRLNFSHSIGEQRRVAIMQIASQIRVWLIETSRVFEEHEARYEPDPNSDPNDPYGYHFPTPSDIPEFPFAKALDRISVLKSADAQSVFILMEQRQIAENEANLAAHLQDPEVAATIFEPRIARVFLDCLEIYVQLAGPIGWTSNVISEREMRNMRGAADRLHDTRFLREGVGLDVPGQGSARSE